MIKYLIRFISVFLLVFLMSYCRTTWPSADKYLQSRHPVVSMEEVAVGEDFQKGWLLFIEQPIDHFNPDKGTFKQRAWLSHVDADSPMVMVTEGYMAPKNYKTELTGLLNCNQIIVEHRYFGESTPDSIYWEFLTVEQAALDHHRIVEMFKKYYSGKWINTGISKGGQTAIIHRGFFPEDVDVTVSYVAPFNLEKEDERLITFFDSVGTPAQREKIHEFQKEVLKRKEELMPYFLELAENKGFTFRMGAERAFELAVLEYPFSMWQWGGPVNQIPEPGAPAEELFAHLHRGTDFGYFSDQQWENIGPFFYQAYKELGYYPYLAAPLRPWLDEIQTDTVSNKFMAPAVEHLTFNKEASYNILNKLKKADPRIILITGEFDPWGATSLDTEGFSNILKIEKPGGSHRTRINNLPDSLKENVMDTLKKWME